MANPNIIDVTNIKGKTVVANVITTATNLVQNSSGSNTIIKLNTLIISNIDTLNNANVAIDIFRNNFAYHLSKNVTVPVESSLDVLSKPIYLEEGDTLRVTASANSRLQSVCSYEEIT